MGKNLRFVLRITVMAGLTCAAPLVTGASQLFTVETASGGGTGICLDLSSGCSLAGLLGSDTALNAGGRYTNFVELGQTGELASGREYLRAHHRRAHTGDGRSHVFGGRPSRRRGMVSTVLGPAPPGRQGRAANLSRLHPRRYHYTSGHAEPVANGRTTSSGIFDFGPGSYALTAVLTLNLQPGQTVPDYARMLEDPNGFYYGTLTVTETAEPASFILLLSGILGSVVVASYRKRCG